jgi:hypothetical protein
MEYIVVLMRTPSHERMIAKIPNVYKHRNRVNEIVDVLNERYSGWFYFTTREICES